MTRLWARRLSQAKAAATGSRWRAREPEIQLLGGFNAAYETQRQCVLDGKTPDQVVAERLKAQPKLSKPKGAFQQRAAPCEITKASFIAETAKGGSQPDE
jgi:hypothetical protein